MCCQRYISLFQEQRKKLVMSEIKNHSYIGHLIVTNRVQIQNNDCEFDIDSHLFWIIASNPRGRKQVGKIILGIMKVKLGPEGQLVLVGALLMLLVFFLSRVRRNNMN